MQNFMVELTDTFAGEANYSWVRRYVVKARTPRGAMRITASARGLFGWRKAWDGGDLVRYDLQGSAVCAFVSPMCEE
jgi:hypothetical protein